MWGHPGCWLKWWGYWGGGGPNFLLVRTFLKVERDFLLNVDHTFVRGTLFTTHTSCWQMNDLSSVIFSMRQSDGRLNLVNMFIFPCLATTLYCYLISLIIAFGQCAFGLLVHCLYNLCSMCASCLVFWLLMALLCDNFCNQCLLAQEGNIFART